MVSRCRVVLWNSCQTFRVRGLEEKASDHKRLIETIILVYVFPRAIIQGTVLWNLCFTYELVKDGKQTVYYIYIKSYNVGI